VINTVYDASTPINASIREVLFTICEGLVLVVLVVYFFLGSVRATIIPAVTIPISLITPFSSMYFFNFSINNFTLLAMVLAIGLVVDDAIVMLENIERHHQVDKNAVVAENNGASEVGFAIIAMTITLIAVFLPIGFLDNFMVNYLLNLLGL
jgi:multidrug efflux pump subunit AcrB